MDALALLCNLHADGPATLQRLRRVGCESLTDLASLDPVELARCLDGEERTLRRFLAEARTLAARLAEDPSFGEARAAPAPAQGEARASHGDPPVLAGVERVLDAWKELDLASPPDEPGEYVLPRPLAAAEEPSLAGLSLEGLTSAMVGALASAGIRSPRDLAEAPAIELARITGLPFTRVKRLQFLARRGDVASQSASPAPSPAREEPGEPPPRGDRLEAAGPFA
jgi:hypothetical protein